MYLAAIVQVTGNLGSRSNFKRILLSTLLVSRCLFTHGLSSNGRVGVEKYGKVKQPPTVDSISAQTGESEDSRNINKKKTSCTDDSW